jgi:O-acetyl-ADP-ribose deacetylase (regulator of RNase III)
MFKFLENPKYPVLLSAFGFLLVIVSHFEIKDITKFQVVKAANPVYSLYILGIFIVLASIAIYLLESEIDSSSNVSLNWLKQNKIIRLDDGFSSTINQSEIRVIFGKIEEIKTVSDDSLIVLPTNEFFDDECIRDTKSSLGAFIQTKYPNQISQLQDLISKQLEILQSHSVEKEAKVFKQSYGVGTAIFLDSPLESKQKLLLIAVTTKRAGEGLRAEMSYIFQVVNEIQRIMADKRLNSVYIPVIGSGHGGLRKESALFGMLLAASDVMKRPYGHHIEKFSIVIFRAEDKEKPSISPNIAKKLLRISTGIFS